MRYASIRAALAALVLAVGCAAHAADTPADPKLSGTDRHFITHATEDGLAEVELGRLAQQNGAHSAVKDLGRRSEAGHARANQELGAIAARYGISVPTQPGSRHQSDIKKFSRLKGADFDREYADHRVRQLEKAVALFEKQARNGDAAELRAYASKTLPALQELLKMAQAHKARQK